MKRFLWILCAASMLVSCDDGDLIVTDFNFENRALQWCGDISSQVLFNINNDQVNEAIAFRFELETPDPQFFATEPGQLVIPLNQENRVVYRVFNGEVKASYFCNSIPPVSPEVVEEFQSTSGGEMIITTTLVDNSDHEGDGIPSTLEGMDAALDTDTDSIPDFLDVDDDQDNILTRVEIEVESENLVDGYADSDNDGIPDYIDADDDNDGVPSINEDWNQNNNPADDQNEAGLAHYLNPEITDSFEITTFRENTFSRNFRYLVTAENLTLLKQGGNGEQIRLENFELGYYDSPAQQVVLEPAGGEVEQDSIP